MPIGDQQGSTYQAPVAMFVSPNLPSEVEMSRMVSCRATSARPMAAQTLLSCREGRTRT